MVKSRAVGSNVKQGIIRDTDGTLTLVIWIRQKSEEKVSYDITNKPTPSALR